MKDKFNNIKLVIKMSQSKSPFQVYVETWWTKEEAEKQHHQIVRKWKNLTMSEKSQYKEASKNKTSIDKNAKIFQF